MNFKSDQLATCYAEKLESNISIAHSTYIELVETVVELIKFLIKISDNNDKIQLEEALNELLNELYESHIGILKDLGLVNNLPNEILQEKNIQKISSNEILKKFMINSKPNGDNNDIKPKFIGDLIQFLAEIGGTIIEGIISEIRRRRNRSINLQTTNTNFETINDNPQKENDNRINDKLIRKLYKKIYKVAIDSHVYLLAIVKLIPPATLENIINEIIDIFEEGINEFIELFIELEQWKYVKKLKKFKTKIIENLSSFKK